MSEFVVEPGQRVPFVLTWYPSHEPIPDPVDAEVALDETEAFWLDWADACQHQGDYHEEIHQSLLVLKALTYQPTGGIVAAPTTSLPEWIGGVRNWDYRYCWLRDATLTLVAMLHAGYRDEAIAWREWLLRAVAGDPADVQIMYGIAGERRLDERELEWLPGFARLAAGAGGQRRLDAAAARRLRRGAGCRVPDARARRSRARRSAGRCSRKVLDWLEDGWREKDAGHLGGARAAAALHALEGDGLGRLRPRRAHARGVRPRRAGRALAGATRRDQGRGAASSRGASAKQAFTQSYGSDELDASVLLMPIVGFLPADDPRFVSTLEAIRRELTVDGLLLRYRTERDEPTACRRAKASSCRARSGSSRCSPCRAAGRRRASCSSDCSTLRNDVGLLSEEYDPAAGRQLGNFPQAFTHLALITAAIALEEGRPVRS